MVKDQQITGDRCQDHPSPVSVYYSLPDLTIINIRTMQFFITSLLAVSAAALPSATNGTWFGKRVT